MGKGANPGMGTTMGPKPPLANPIRVTGGQSVSPPSGAPVGLFPGQATTTPAQNGYLQTVAQNRLASPAGVTNENEDPFQQMRVR